MKGSSSDSEVKFTVLYTSYSIQETLFIISNDWPLREENVTITYFIEASTMGNLLAALAPKGYHFHSAGSTSPQLPVVAIKGSCITD